MAEMRASIVSESVLSQSIVSTSFDEDAIAEAERLCDNKRVAQ